MVASQKILLQLAATGMKAELIASNLCVNVRTIENRLLSLRKRSGCKTTMELVLWAIARRVIENPFDIVIQSPNTGRD